MLVSFVSFWPSQLKTICSLITSISLKIIKKNKAFTQGDFDTFRSRLLDHFDVYYEGEIRTYLGCEIERDITKDITSLGQKHYAEEVFYTYNTWNYHHSTTVLPPNLRLRKEDCDLSPDPVFHSRSRDIVGSLDYLVNMTRSYLVFDLISLLCIPNSANMFNSRSNSMWPPLTTCFGIFTARMKRSFSSVVVSNTSISSGVGSMPIGPLTPELHRYPPISYRFCPHVQWWINQLQVPSTGFRHSFNFGDWTHDCHRGRERGRVHLHSVLSDTILQDFGFTPKGPTNLYEDNLASRIIRITPCVFDEMHTGALFRVFSKSCFFLRDS